jgi:hypothetical protein
MRFVLASISAAIHRTRLRRITDMIVWNRNTNEWERIPDADQI